MDTKEIENITQIIGNLGEEASQGLTWFLLTDLLDTLLICTTLIIVAYLVYILIKHLVDREYNSSNNEKELKKEIAELHKNTNTLFEVFKLPYYAGHVTRMNHMFKELIRLYEVEDNYKEVLSDLDLSHNIEDLERLKDVHLIIALGIKPIK